MPLPAGGQGLRIRAVLNGRLMRFGTDLLIFSGAGADWQRSVLR